MTHIICEPCVGVKDTACVDVCPVDCIYGKKEDWEMLFIQPEECIDCGLCVDACPVQAESFRANHANTNCTNTQAAKYDSGSTILLRRPSR